MSNSIRLGFMIAALFAAAVLGYSFFGTRHESWFVRAAQGNAVRCLTKTPCTALTIDGVMTAKAPPPLASTSPCASPDAWRQLKTVSNGQTRIVLTCSDGTTYLYHMGTLKGRDAGNEQWMRCGGSGCEAEGRLFAAN